MQRCLRIQGATDGQGSAQPRPAQCRVVRDTGTPGGLYMSMGAHVKPKDSHPHDYVQPKYPLLTDWLLVTQPPVPQTAGQAHPSLSTMPVTSSTFQVVMGVPLSQTFSTPNTAGPAGGFPVFAAAAQSPPVC